MRQSPTQRVAYLAWQLAQAVGARVERDVRRLDLSGAQSLALFTLGLSPGLTIADIARRTSMTPQSMGSAVNALISGGLVQAIPAAQDKRSKRLSLTAEGERVAAQAETIIIRLNEDLLGDLDPERRTMALEIMTGMLKRFNPDALRLDEESAP